jgi:hypothetical protein
VFDSEFKGATAIATITDTADDDTLAVLQEQYDGTSDRALLDQITAAQVAQNKAHASRLDLVHRFHARRVAEHDADGEPDVVFFQLTPLRETQAEIAPLLGLSDQLIAVDIDTVTDMLEWLPRLWARCLSGRLDLSRALCCHEQLQHLATDADRTSYASAIQDWFDKHDPVPDDVDAGQSAELCRLPRQKIQRAARYQRLKLPQRPDKETFAQAFKKRAVHLRIDEESGMATLCGRHPVHDAVTADHRLTLIAKHLAQEPGETRTLAQLRADTLLDLIHGRLTAPATTGDLEHHEGCDAGCRATGEAQEQARERARAAAQSQNVGGAGQHESETHATPGHEGSTEAAEQWHCPLHPRVLTTDTGGPIGGYARPVINLTVPYTTVLGVDDQPGMLSGGVPIPADLARDIALDPTSTWYRMLTDPAGGFVELSTRSYQPTQPIKNTVDARDQTCRYPSCARPAVACEYDHRTPHPEGRTSVSNGQPLCERHHQVKHARGYTVTRNADGSDTWTTRHGSTFVTPAPEQPHVSDADAAFHELTSPLEREFTELLRREVMGLLGRAKTVHKPGRVESAGLTSCGAE